MTDESANQTLKQQLLSYGLNIEEGWVLSGFLDFEAPVSFQLSCRTARVDIGSFTYLRRGVSLDEVRIGRYCSLASGVSVGPDNHPIDGLSTSTFPYENETFGFFDGYRPSEPLREKPQTAIGHDVWIGRDAMIMAGVTVHSGAVIAAKAVVTKDVHPYTIVAGVPARPVRRRFNDSTIARLIDLRWWDYDIRSWLSQNPTFATIPLTDEKLEVLENAIRVCDLKELRPAKARITFADGKLRIDRC